MITKLLTPLFVKAALIGLTMLLVAFGAQSLRVYLIKKDLAVAVAERDAAKTNLQSCATDNAGWEKANAEVHTALAACQSDWTTLDLTSKNAIAQAQAERDAAEKKHNTFVARWTKRTPTCDTALKDMELACRDEIGDY